MKFKFNGESLETASDFYIGGKPEPGSWLDKFNEFTDKVVGTEVEYISDPIGAWIKEKLMLFASTLTDYMPEIGAFITVICAVGIMLTGNAPKWLARWSVGIGGAIIWLLNAHS